MSAVDQQSAVAIFGQAGEAVCVGHRHAGLLDRLDRRIGEPPISEVPIEGDRASRACEFRMVTIRLNSSFGAQDVAQVLATSIVSRSLRLGDANSCAAPRLQAPCAPLRLLTPLRSIFYLLFIP